MKIVNNGNIVRDFEFAPQTGGRPQFVILANRSRAIRWRGENVEGVVAITHSRHNGHGNARFAGVIIDAELADGWLVVDMTPGLSGRRTVLGNFATWDQVADRLTEVIGDARVSVPAVLALLRESCDKADVARLDKADEVLESLNSSGSTEVELHWSQTAKRRYYPVVDGLELDFPFSYNDDLQRALENAGFRVLFAEAGRKQARARVILPEGAEVDIGEALR